MLFAFVLGMIYDYITNDKLLVPYFPNGHDEQVMDQVDQIHLKITERLVIKKAVSQKSV